MEYNSKIGRYSKFPVHLVLVTTENSKFWQFFGRHSAVLLKTGQIFQLRKSEVEKLETEISNYQHTLKIAGMIVHQQQNNKPS